MEAEAERLTAMRERLRSQLSVLEEIYVNGHPQQRLPGNLNISVGGVDGAALLLGLQGMNSPQRHLRFSCAIAQGLPRSIASSAPMPIPYFVGDRAWPLNIG